MLGIMRKYKESIVIKIVFVLIVLSFIGTIFLVWGEGGTGGKNADFAVKINGGKIPTEEYQKSYYRLKNMYEQLNGKSLTPEQEKQVGLRKLAVDSLVDTALMRAEAKRMGIKVTKEEVRKAIEAVPTFQKEGVFDFQLYQDVLKMSRLSPDKFEEAQKQDLILQKARQQVQDKAAVTDDEALQAFRKQNDRIELLYTSYSPEEVKGEIKLTEQDLTAYLQANQEKFKTPEQISVSFAVFDPSAVTAKQTVSDEEAQAYYQKNIDRYQGKGGILPYAEVQERVKVDARAFKGARQAYELAADAINKHKGGDIAAAATSLGAKVTDTALFTAAAPAAQLAGEPEVVKRAFALKEGEFGGPVETKKGIYILKVKERKPAAVPPLDRIRAQVEQGALNEKAKELAKKKAEQALAELTKPNPSLKLQETGSFAYNTKWEIPKLGSDPAIMEAAFDLTPATPVARNPFQVGNRWYAVKLKTRTEVNKDAFAKQKEQIKQGLLPKKQQDAVETWLKDLKAKAKIEINPALLAD